METPGQVHDDTGRRVVSGEKAHELASSQTVNFDPKAFDAMLATVSGSASSGDMYKALKRRMVSIVIEPDMCRPETFRYPFRLEMIELDSDQELRALARLGRFTMPPTTNETEDGEDDEGDLPDGENATSAGQALAMALAREAICSVNGRRLASHEKSLLWEILGFSGRLAAGMTFIAHGTGLDADLLGKSIASVEIS